MASALLGYEYGGRCLSPAWAQAWVVFQRSAAKTLNSARELLLMDLAVLAAVSLVLGAVQGHTQQISRLAPQFAMTTTAFAMFCTIAGEDRRLRCWSVAPGAGLLFLAVPPSRP